MLDDFKKLKGNYPFIDWEELKNNWHTIKEIKDGIGAWNLDKLGIDEVEFNGQKGFVVPTILDIKRNVKGEACFGALVLIVAAPNDRIILKAFHDYENLRIGWKCKRLC